MKTDSETWCRSLEGIVKNPLHFIKSMETKNERQSMIQNGLILRLTLQSTKNLQNHPNLDDEHF
jgi:hypothetical protein